MPQIKVPGRKIKLGTSVFRSLLGSGRDYHIIDRPGLAGAGRGRNAASRRCHQGSKVHLSIKGSSALFSINNTALWKPIMADFQGTDPASAPKKHSRNASYNRSNLITLRTTLYLPTLN